MALLEISNLHLSLSTFEGEAKILNGIDLTVESGEICGIVGETGCGKSLTGLSVSRLVPSPPASYTSGSIRFDGQDLMHVDEEAMRALRGRRIGMIFQDPTTNLNPLFRVGEQIIDVALHAARVDPSVLGLPAGSAGRHGRKQAARRVAIDMLTKVGIDNATARIDDYPHQFSGGMRQRVLIAMALIGRPALLIADEPTTALDVSVQAQILKLIVNLVREYRLAVLLITHNIGVVAQVCSRVAVMYAGTIVESGPVDSIFRYPAHPYTRALLACLPTAGVPRGKLAAVAGSIPDPYRQSPGCSFAARCASAVAICRQTRPLLATVRPGHTAACVLAKPT